MNPSFLVPSVGNAAPELGATFSITSSTNVVLPPSSQGLQSISMTVLGQSVLLPPTYAIVPGQTKYAIKNNGTYPFGVRDSSGTLLVSITPAGYATFSLDNSSNWDFTGTNLEYALVTIDNSFGSVFSNGNVINVFASLDSNTSIHFGLLSSGFAAFVVDNQGKVVSTPVTVDATASSQPVQAFKISSTSAIVFFGASTTNNSAVVLTLTGASPSYSLSVGTAQNINTQTLNSARWDSENFFSAPKICQLTSTLFAATFYSSSAPTGIDVVAISVSGAVITIGTIVNVASTGVSVTSCIFTLTSSTVLIYYKTPSSPAPISNVAVVVSIAGVVCTVASPVTLTGCASTVTTQSNCVLLSPTKFLVNDNNNVSGSVIVSTFTIAGTVITAGTPLTVETGTGANQFYTSQFCTRYNPHLWAIGPNAAGLWYLDSAGISRCLVITENAGTLTAGTIFYKSISGAATGTSDSGIVLTQGVNEFVAIRMEGISGAWKTRVVSHKISGTSISSGVGYPLFEVPNSVDVSSGQFTICRLPSGDYISFGTLATFSVAAELSLFRNSGDYISYRSKVSAIGLTVTAAINIPAIPAVSNNRVVIIGNTNYQGTNISAALPQTRLLNVEIAQ